MPAYRQIPIDEATDAQVKAFAEMIGLEIESNETPARIRAKLAAVHQSPTIGVRDEAATAPAPARIYTEAGAAFSAKDIGGAKLAAGPGRDDPRATIQIDIVEQGGVTMKEDVGVGVNGCCFQLKRGLPLDVPWRVVEALKLANKTVITHVFTQDGETLEMEAEMPSHPWRMLQGPSAAEIATWFERTKGIELA